MFKILLSFIFCLSSLAFAQEPEVSALTMRTWKEQQILDAQNQVLRISARLSQFKNGKSESSANKEATPLNSKIKKTETDTQTSVERDLRRAQESLRAANELTLDDYITIYLPTLRDSPEALQALTQKLSKDEMAEIVKVLIRKDGAPDARRNGPSLADSLSVTARAKAP